LNLCCPDSGKSCAACCGLYNVPVATRAVLHARLIHRTSLFEAVHRHPDAIQDFGARIRIDEGNDCLDPEIHVCPYAGFIDHQHACVGCMLHPSAPGNEGTDLRGLCYYGSLACKSFYCDSWRSLPIPYKSILSHLIADWHLWGLAATDHDFVLLLFGLLDSMLGRSFDERVTRQPQARSILLSMLQWKDSWPLAHESQLRRSRYYVSPEFVAPPDDPDKTITMLIRCIDFTYGTSTRFPDGAEIIRSAVNRFVASYEVPF